MTVDCLNITFYSAYVQCLTGWMDCYMDRALGRIIYIEKTNRK